MRCNRPKKTDDPALPSSLRAVFCAQIYYRKVKRCGIRADCYHSYAKSSACYNFLTYKAKKKKKKVTLGVTVLLNFLVQICAAG